MSNTQSKPILQRAVGAVFLLALIALVAVLLLQPSGKVPDSTVKSNPSQQPTISITANDKKQTNKPKENSQPSLILESTATTDINNSENREPVEVIGEDIWQSVEQKADEDITPAAPILIASADDTQPHSSANSRTKPTTDTPKTTNTDQKAEITKPAVTTPKLELIADSEKTTTPAKPPQRSSKATSNGNWYVQIGAFGNAANAQKLVNQYQQQGYNVRIQKDNNLNRVQIGPFTTKQEAERVQSKTKTQSINPAVIHLP